MSRGGIKYLHSSADSTVNTKPTISKSRKEYAKLGPQLYKNVQGRGISTN